MSLVFMEMESRKAKITKRKKREGRKRREKRGRGKRRASGRNTMLIIYLTYYYDDHILDAHKTLL